MMVADGNGRGRGTRKDESDEMCNQEMMMRMVILRHITFVNKYEFIFLALLFFKHFVLDEFFQIVKGKIQIHYLRAIRAMMLADAR